MDIVNRKNGFLGLLVGLFILAGCGGVGGDSNGSSVGTRVVTGTFGSVAPAALKSHAEHEGEGEAEDEGEDVIEEEAGGCPIDSITATSTAGDETTATVEDDCGFEIELPVGKSFKIEFSLRGEIVATLVFTSGIGGFSSSDLFVAGGNMPIDLGEISLEDGVAIPHRNPMEQCDEDDDGLNDLLDDDDDNDGLRDAVEIDCDLDGFRDDHDDLRIECEVEVEIEREQVVDAEAKVVEVRPRNDPQPELGRDLVDLDRDIRARINCLVDPATVNADTFRVSHNEEALMCEFRIEHEVEQELEHGVVRQGEKTTVKCRHEEDMAADAVFMATLEGLKCLDGRSVTAKSWNWRTEMADEEEGDREGDLDDGVDENEDDDDDDLNDAPDDDEAEDEAAHEAATGND